MAYLFLVIWIGFLSLTAIGTWIVFRRLGSPPIELQPNPTETSPVAVSILKPLKGLDPELEFNLRSFFELLHTAPFELLFSVESQSDPAYSVVEKLIADYPEVSAKVFISSSPYAQCLFPRLGPNPKLNNLASSYEAANYDTILISDSNVRVAPNTLIHLTQELDANAGIVTSIVVGTEPSGLGGFLESVFLNTFYARWNSLANEYGKPCVVGKSMLFRKSTAARFGGIKTLSQFLAEDFMAGESMAKLGLKVKTARVPVIQIIGRQNFLSFWKRHERWGRIRKSHAPLAYLAEPLSNALFISLIGAFTLDASLHIAPRLGFFYSTLFLMICDWIQFQILIPRFTAKSALFPVIWLIREIIGIPLWLWIGCRKTVNWRGRRLHLAPGGLLVENENRWQMYSY